MRRRPVTIFLNLVKFIVIPIVLFSIMSGIISMKDIKKVGSIGIKTVIYYLCTTRCYNKYGWNCYLSGRLCYIYRILLWHKSYVFSDGYNSYY